MGKDASKWSNRDILAVFYIIVCIFFAWCMDFNKNSGEVDLSSIEMV